MEVLTTEQMHSRLDAIMATKGGAKNNLERKMALIELRCRCLQSSYYEIGDIVNYINEELRLIEELDRLTMEMPGEHFLPKAKARMKVIASTCMAVFRRAGITMANIDATCIARLIGFMSGYSEDNIRKYIRDEMKFERSDMEAAQAEALLLACGITDKLIL